MRAVALAVLAAVSALLAVGVLFFPPKCLAASGGGGGVALGVRGSLVGGGSSFIAPQMFAWSREFYRLSGGAAVVNYQSVGSGAGVAQLLERRLDFAASDVPLPRDRYAAVGGRVFQFPVAVGSIVVVYNVPEVAYVETGRYLNLTAEVLALIYMGVVRQWCDVRIRELNPGLADRLPCRDIVAVHRSDGSGTTAAFTLFLSRAYPPWNSTVGWGLVVRWPVDAVGRGVGAKGNEGVAQAVLQNAYSIGYVEYAYWVKNRGKFDEVGGVAYVRNDNDGRFYFPTAESVSEAVSAGLERYLAKYGAPPGPGDDWNPVSMEFSNPPRGYPIVSFTYIILWRDYVAEGYGNAGVKAKILREFFRWVLTEGQRRLVDGYIALPREVAEVGLRAVEVVKP